MEITSKSYLLLLNYRALVEQQYYIVVVVNEVICCTKRIDGYRYYSCSSILFFYTYKMCDIIIKYLFKRYTRYLLDF